MTVPVSDRLSPLYVGNGVQVRFDFTFNVFQQEDSTGITIRAKNGSEFEAIDPAKYAVTLNNDGNGGYITFISPPDITQFFYIMGSTAVDQLLDITNYNNFYPDALERALDKITAILQEWYSNLDQETLSRILADINYDNLAKQREADLKAYIDGIASAIFGWPVIGLPSVFVDTGIGDLPNQKVFNDKTVTTVESIADLANLEKWEGRTIYAKSFTESKNMGGGNFKFDSSLVATNDHGLIINGWVRQNVTGVYFEFFGAIGDGVVDDTLAIQRAVDFSKKNGVPVLGMTGKNYKITDTIELVDRPSASSYRSAKVWGSNGGDINCKLTFVGTDPDKPGIRALGNIGEGGANSAFGVQFCGFNLQCQNWAGDGIHWENVAIWSLLQDIEVWYAGGNGITAIGYTDHIWRNVEVRYCKKYGIYSYEPRAETDGYFKEVSYMKFDGVRAFGSNKNGTQWYFWGGNGCTFLHCKPSEGTIGLDFYHSFGMSLIQTYSDGTIDSTIDSANNIMIRFNADIYGESVGHNVLGYRTWNIKYAVVFDNSGSQSAGLSTVSCGNLNYNNATVGSDVYDVYVKNINKPVVISNSSRILNAVSDKSLVSTNSINKYTSYSTVPTIANGSISLGNAELTSRHITNDNEETVLINFKYGSTTAITGNYLTFTLPVQTSLTGQSLKVSAHDVSANKFYFGEAVITDQAAILFFENGQFDSGTQTPFSFSVGDTISISGRYFIS